ncbi:DNA-binding domain-containing protein [Novosphingobium sp.]|uniref:HvfC/BufC N-terminal domain-containing protein n=1 Tax=Novosphingobium sp. TaxID=1874826 RepID=UPI003D0F297D
MTEPLADLQTRFCAWLREGDEDLAARLAPALRVGPGLTVYQNNYRTTLVEALRETHPRALLWLGDAAFESIAARFIDAQPSSHWTIDAYGAGFPALLHKTAGAIAAELAAIDRAVGEVFVGPDAVPVQADALADVDWDGAVIRLVPSLVVLPIATNADALWLALANGDAVPAADHAAPGTLMLWRQGFEPVMRRLDGGEAVMLERSIAGASFAAICEELAQSGDEAAAVTAAGTVLGRWLGESLIAGFD